MMICDHCGEKIGPKSAYVSCTEAGWVKHNHYHTDCLKHWANRKRAEREARGASDAAEAKG